MESLETLLAYNAQVLFVKICKSWDQYMCRIFFFLLYHFFDIYLIRNTNYEGAAKGLVTQNHAYLKRNQKFNTCNSEARKANQTVHMRNTYEDMVGKNTAW